jgi:S-adenosylmethionine-diacylgycerolhomoserine-N-methlytransferase
MLRSISPASPPEADRQGLAALARFYAWNAPLYDWTRPAILYARGEAVERLAPRPGERVLDVGCGTGWSLGRLAATGADVVGIECAPAMLARARRRIAGLGLLRPPRLEARPYGGHDGRAGAVDAILFSYSLSMMPGYLDVVAQVLRDLRGGGRITVVDFLDARQPMAAWLTTCHVVLGPARLEALRSAFPAHHAEIRQAPLWRYFLFSGTR